MTCPLCGSTHCMPAASACFCAECGFLWACANDWQAMRQLVEFTLNVSRN